MCGEHERTKAVDLKRGATFRFEHTQTHRETHLTIGNASSDDSRSVVSSKTNDHNTKESGQSFSRIHMVKDGVLGSGERRKRHGTTSRLYVPHLWDSGLSLEGVGLRGGDKLGGGSRVVNGGVGVLEVGDDVLIRLLDVGRADIELLEERHVLSCRKVRVTRKCHEQHFRRDCGSQTLSTTTRRPLSSFLSIEILLPTSALKWPPAAKWLLL